MKPRVGIPRAMGYYYLYPFFRTLLVELGAEPVLSPPTTTRLLERMESCPTDEPCLAVKLHFGHADALASRDDIDFLFLPVIARVEKTWCCPKFIGI
ncbi:MAG TPA: acyl-CoA dehydratase activase-related protein, partial [Armatimonadota bacterium]